MAKHKNNKHNNTHSPQFHFHFATTITKQLRHEGAMPLDDAATHLFSMRTNVRVSSQRVERQQHEKDTITLTYLLLLPFKVDCHISHPPTTAPTRTVAVATGRQQSTATQRKVRAEMTTLLLFVTVRMFAFAIASFRLNRLRSLEF